MERVEAVWEAISRCPQYVPSEIERATGQELHAMLAGLLPGLLLALGVMAVTTLGGTVAGAAIGALAGGVGAAPGAAAGASLGAEAGAWILEYLGLAFLVAYVGASLIQAVKDAAAAVEIAWHSIDVHDTSNAMEIDRAAHGLALAIADIFRGVLQGVVAFLLSKGAGAAKGQMPELVGKLRVSKLGEGFATWVERNWEGLVKEPKLQSGAPVAKGAGGESAAATSGAQGAAAGASPKPVRTSELPPIDTPPKPPPVRRIPVTGSRMEAVHDGALHNQDWNKIGVSDFKATRPEGIDNLSPSDEAAADILKKNGYSGDKIDEVLNSGHDFAPRQFTKGETMYGFDSSDYLGKDANSAYWMDEASYKDVESKFKQGDAWDRQGVKEYLALPCFNKADGLVQGVVSEDHVGVTSTIGKATENVTYQAADGTVVPQALTLPGGGTQVTPAIGKIVVPSGD